MNRLEFEKVISEEFPKAVPEKFRSLVHNVAFLVEEKPAREVRKEERLSPNETLLGLYRGVPRSMRGDTYGIGSTLPDVIVLYRQPIHNEALSLLEADEANSLDEAVRQVVHDTIWHEIAHYLGLGEDAVRTREEERKQLSQSVSSYRTHQDQMEPIEVDTEDSRMQRILHTTLIPRTENASSIDPEGGGPGIREWWESERDEKPLGLLPEDIPPPGSPEKAGDERYQSKKGKPPPNLPTHGS